LTETEVGIDLGEGAEFKAKIIEMQKNDGDKEKPKVILEFNEQAKEKLFKACAAPGTCFKLDESGKEWMQQPTHGFMGHLRDAELELIIAALIEAGVGIGTQNTVMGERVRQAFRSGFQYIKQNRYVQQGAYLGKACKNKVSVAYDAIKKLFGITASNDNNKLLQKLQKLSLTSKKTQLTEPIIEKLLNTGRHIDRNGLSKAGRALQKHGDRGGAFPKTRGKLIEINNVGQKILEEILTSTVQIKSNKFNGIDVTSINGRGARFDETLNFIGFLEP